jgi:hypothetical protein
MSRLKKKSSGWLPSEKRRTPQQVQARWNASAEAQARVASDRFRQWRDCPLGCCRRARACVGAPSRCPDARQRALADPRAENKPRFAMSAKEAAAAITASIANMKDEGPLSGA